MRSPQPRCLIAASLLVAALSLTGCSRDGPTQASQAAAATASAVNEERVRITNGDVMLAGTLLLPEGRQPRPAVVLFHGSGPQERDLRTARWFAEHGVAALAYDKRGVGESTGDFRKGPFMDLCDDGLAAIAYLKSRKEVDIKRIGVWGLSQGGWLGPMAASRSGDVTWVIAVSGPGVSPGEQMIVHYANELRRQDVPERDVEEASALRREVYEYLYAGKGYEKVKADLDAARRKRWYAPVNAQQDRLFEPLQRPGDLTDERSPRAVRFAREMHYDPVPALEALRVPALFLFGDKDWLIPVEESVKVIQRVKAGGNHDFTIQVFQNVDHGMFVTAGDEAGSKSREYGAAMQAWLAAHVLNKTQ